jgi:hypothetical protein
VAKHGIELVQIMNAPGNRLGRDADLFAERDLLVVLVRQELVQGRSN